MTDREALAAVVRARICVCGHPASDHETECAFGWTGEPDEAEPCACESFAALAEEPR